MQPSVFPPSFIFRPREPSVRMRRTQSLTPTRSADTLVEGSGLRRASSLPAGYGVRRPIVSFSTDITSHPANSPKLSRMFPNLRVEMVQPVHPSERHGVAVIVERAKRRRAAVVTHTVTVDAWLLMVLLLFSLVASSSGFVLPTVPVGAQRFNPADVAPHVAGAAGVGYVPVPSQPRTASVKNFVADPDPSLAAAMEFLGWNKQFEKTAPEAAFATEVARRKRSDAAAPAVAKPRKISTGAELAHELSQPSDVPTVVVFGAKTCRMCRMVQPKLEKAAAKAGVPLLYMHYNKKSDDVYRELAISQTPTVHVYDAAGTLVSSDVYKVADVPKLKSVLEELMVPP